MSGFSVYNKHVKKRLHACKITNAASIIFPYRRSFMIMAISAEIMLQKSGLAFKNFHQTIENLILNYLDCMIYVLVR